MVIQPAIRQLIRASGLGIAGLALLLGLVTSQAQVAASISPDPAIPTTAIALEDTYAQLPDWAQITLRTLPPILADGGFVVPPDLTQTLGYDLSRMWQAGQTADTYLKLGDLQTSLYPQLFNLHSIAQLTDLDLSQVTLSRFAMVTQQTLNDWVTALPGLGNYSVEQIPAIASLISLTYANADLNTTLADLLITHADLGQLQLAQLGEQLDQFAITDIPGLDSVPIQNLHHWQNSFIAQVPGLADVPLNQMPNPIDMAGVMGTVDVVYGPAERDRHNTISGSKQVGFSATCNENCAHMELTGTPGLHGKQWVSGKYQQVEGGFGILGMVNGGKEPTGRHPFGEVFKVSIWDVEESTGQVSTALHFRICQRGGGFAPDLGCTPYFLGPIPFLNYRETAPIFVGLLDDYGGASSLAAVPAGVLEKAAAMGIPVAALPGQGGGFEGDGSLCGEGPGGVDFSALAAAFSDIEGNYDSVGSYVCDGRGTCGRGLGRYQYMSYRADVRQLISQRDGGTAFLARVDAGEAISAAEVERFFPAGDQDGIFKADQTRNIEQAMAEGFSGDRLIERVGQLHFGGSGAPIDGSASDVHGRLTLKTYGEELSQQYQSAIAAGAGNACAVKNDSGGTPPSGELNQQVYQSLGEMGHFDTSAGPDGGNLACAWAVNRVLENAGIAPVGSNPNYVPSVESALQSGRGTQINQTQAQAGDIVIAPNGHHIGFCLNDGCTQVRSNSSSRAQFAWDSNFNFDGVYGGGQSRVYRLGS